MSTLIEQRQIRLEKVAKLRKLGINPYPAQSRKDYPNSEITDNFDNYQGKTVSLTGRLMAIRDQGQLWFGDLVDQSGRIQIFARKDGLQKTDVTKQNLGVELLDLLDIGDFVQIEGKIDKTSRGEISILPGSIKLLTKTLRPLPEKWSGLKDTEIIFRRRYLDLATNPERKSLFIRKANFWALCRKFMQDNGFIEVETPVLELVTGGADAKPFTTHHNALDQDFYLRISTELYQKRLIGGGFEKIYTLGPNFRNEGIDDEHLQEYYSLEWYWAYADYQNNIDLTEQLYKLIAQEIYGKTKFTKGKHEFDFAGKWPRIGYAQAIKDRFDVNIFSDSEKEIIAKLKELRVDTTGLTNIARIVDNLWKIVRQEISGPCFIVDEPKFTSPLAKSKSEDDKLTERFHIIIAGSELGNGYSELNDPVDQLERFKEQQDNRDAGDEESQMLDIDFVEMLEQGMPPTSGFGMSERLFWFMENITAREGTLFPQMRYELEDDTKKIYGIKENIKKEKK